MKGLLTSSLASAARTTGAWSLTFLIQVRINSWKRSLFGIGAGVGARASGVGAGHLRAGLPQRARGMVESGAESGDEEKEEGFSLPSKRAD